MMSFCCRSWASILFYASLWSLCFHDSQLTAAFSSNTISGRTRPQDIFKKCRRCHDSISPVRSLNSDTLLEECLSVAVDAAQRAGEIIRSYDQGAAVVNHKANSRDLLTVVDPLCEKVRKYIDGDICISHPFFRSSKRRSKRDFRPIAFWAKKMLRPGLRRAPVRYRLNWQSKRRWTPCYGSWIVRAFIPTFRSSHNSY